MNEQEIIEMYGKSIWDMTAEEITQHDLDDVWVALVDEMPWWAEAED